MSEANQFPALLEAAVTATAKKLVEEAVKPLRDEVARLIALTDQNVDTAMAMKIMGVGRAWLEKERKRPGTLLDVSYAGSKPTYSRASLIAAKEARKPRKHSTTRTFDFNQA